MLDKNVNKPIPISEAPVEVMEKLKADMASISKQALEAVKKNDVEEQITNIELALVEIYEVMLNG